MTARSEGVRDLAIPDLERRAANTVRYGRIAAVDLAGARVRVESGDITTAWLPWAAGRAAAGKRTWSPPEVGEQVAILSAGGDLRQGLVIPGVYQDAYGAPSSDGDADRTEYGDGTVIEYHRGSHTLKADLGNTKLTANRTQAVLQVGSATLTITGSTITLSAGGGTLVVGSGGVQTTGTLTNNAKNVGSTHTHGGVATGGGTTGVPS